MTGGPGVCRTDCRGPEEAATGFAVGRSVERARAGQVQDVLAAFIQLAIMVALLGGALLLGTGRSPLAAPGADPIAPASASAALAPGRGT